MQGAHRRAGRGRHGGRGRHRPSPPACAGPWTRRWWPLHPRHGTASCTTSRPARPSPGWSARFTTIRWPRPVPLADAARTRRPLWLPDVPPGRALSGGRRFQLRPDRGRRRAAVAGRAAARRRPGRGLPNRPRRFTAAERSFLLTVAGQAAAALERAALADVRREMAETLQRSLLPTALPEPDRLAVSARYLPAVAGTSAGGDWYDVLALRTDGSPSRSATSSATAHRQPP